MAATTGYGSAAAQARANLDTLLSTSGPAMLAGIMDQHFHNKNVFLAYVSRDGSVGVDGFDTGEASGDSLIWSLAIGENSTIKITAGAEQVAFSKQETATQAQLAWAWIQGNLSFDKVDLLNNTGKNKVHDLVDLAMNQATATIKKKINADLVSRGTGSASTVVVGLKDIVGCGATGAITAGASTTGYGPTLYGGVSVVDFTDHQARVMNSNGLDSLVADLGRLLNDVGGGGGSRPSLVLTDEMGFSLYEAKVAGKQIVTQTKVGDGSFDSLTIRGVPMHFDPALTLAAQADVTSAVVGAADTASTHRYYALDASTFKWRWHSEANLGNAFSGWITPYDYPKQVKQILIGCQLACTARHRNGLLRNVAES